MNLVVKEVYHVKTDVFEGPLELLLDLIEKRKLLINQVALAKVADDFIAHIQRRDSFPLKETAQFVLVAATLLLIKSRSLLPQLVLTKEENASIEELEHRLRLYQIVRNIAKTLRTRFGKVYLYHQRYRRTFDPIFVPDVHITQEMIRETIMRVIRALPKEAPARPVALVEHVVSLETMIERLTDRIVRAYSMSFQTFARSASGAPRIEIVVSFLALLELVKQGIVRAEQKTQYADILMQYNEIDVPQYGRK